MQVEWAGDALSVPYRKRWLNVVFSERKNIASQVVLKCHADEGGVTIFGVADHGKAGNAVDLTVVIQNIRESLVHLVRFTGFCNMSALLGCLGTV